MHAPRLFTLVAWLGAAVAATACSDSAGPPDDDAADSAADLASDVETELDLAGDLADDAADTAGDAEDVADASPDADVVDESVADAPDTGEPDAVALDTGDDAAPECGAHAVWDATAEPAACVCVAGYVLSEGACVWGVAPRDPGFEDASQWQASGTALVDDGATGETEPGEASFDGVAVCEGGRVSQVFTMPPWELAEPFVLSATCHYNEIYADVTPTLLVGGQWVLLPEVEEAWRADRVCLGLHAYGGPTELGIGFNDPPTDCGGSAYDVACDRLVIVPADEGECPEPGEVLNGDFESASGWELEPYDFVGEGAVAEIRAGGGRDGSAGLVLATPNACSSARAMGRLSVPLPTDVAAPALTFWWSGEVGGNVWVLLGDRRLTELRGTGEAQTSTVCLPPWALGAGLSLTFEMPPTSGSCGEPLATEGAMAIDDLAVASEATCATAAALSDGGFELAVAGLAPGWVLEGNDPGEGVTKHVLVDAAAAHSGSGVLELQVEQNCRSAAARAWAMVPPEDDTGGPAVTFWHHVGDNPETRATIEVFDATELAEGGGWTQEVVCLDPALAGRLVPVVFELRDLGGTCAVTFAPETARFDDVVVTTHASCPAE